MSFIDVTYLAKYCCERQVLHVIASRIELSSLPVDLTWRNLHQTKVLGRFKFLCEKDSAPQLLKT